MVDLAALLAVGLFAAVFLAILGRLYGEAQTSHRRGELEGRGLQLLRWAIAGQLVIYAVLALTAFVR
jgi:hypothetical protein